MVAVIEPEAIVELVARLSVVVLTTAEHETRRASGYGCGSGGRGVHDDVWPCHAEALASDRYISGQAA